MMQAPDWELDYYSRPILEADGKKRWELLICSTPEVSAGDDGTSHQFRWVQTCPATSVNSIWLKEALEQALCAAEDQGFAPPRRLRCWRASMRTMVQRAAEGLGMELVYPQEPGYMAGPLAPPPQPLRPIAVPLPEAARGESWAWASLPLEALAGAGEWDLGFAGLVPLPSGLEAEVPVPGIRLFSPSRALALAGWLAGLEPVRLEISGLQLVLEAGMEDRWLLTNLDQAEAEAAARAFAAARTQAGGLQFMAVQANEADQRFEGFWLLRDLPDA